MSSSQIFTSSEFSLAFCISCSFTEARDISSFLRSAFNFVDSAWWLRLISANVLLALQGKRLVVSLRMTRLNEARLTFPVETWRVFSSYRIELPAFSSCLSASFCLAKCVLLDPSAPSRLVLFARISLKNNQLSQYQSLPFEASRKTYACKSENVDSSDAKWFAFNSLSLFKSPHFFSYDCAICSFSAISSEIAFSYASTTPLKYQTLRWVNHDGQPNLNRPTSF